MIDNVALAESLERLAAGYDARAGTRRRGRCSSAPSRSASRC